MAAKSNLTNMVLVLGATCLFCSAILGGAYALTKEPIEAAAAEKTNRAIAQVLPAFETAGERQFVEALGKDFPYYEAKNGEDLAGYAIESTVVGLTAWCTTPPCLPTAKRRAWAPSAPRTPSSCPSGRDLTLPLKNCLSRKTVAMSMPSPLPPSLPAPMRRPWRMPWWRLICCRPRMLLPVPPNP